MKYLLAPLLLGSVTATANSNLSPSEIYELIAPALTEKTTIEICVEDECSTFEYQPVENRLKDIIYNKQHKSPGTGAGDGEGADLGKTVGQIVSGVTGQMGAGGKVSVSYSKNTTTNKDGSTTDSVNVKVDVTVGTGNAAPAAVQ